MTLAPRALLWLLPLLALAPVRAQDGPRSDVFWEDPLLEEAVRGADLIVLGEVTAVSSDAATWQVTRTLAGPTRDGAALVVSGLHHPELESTPPVARGDRAYLLLLGDARGSSLHLPTPTFGRFPLKMFGPKPLVIASLGDTFTRLPVEPARFEALLLALRGGESAGLLREARAELAQEALDTPALYAALRLLAFFGAGEDAARVLPLLRRPELLVDARWVLRMAAADALGRAGGPEAIRQLLDLAGGDPVLAVRSAAARALASALVALPDAALQRQSCEALARLANDASSEPIHTLEAEDPRRNEIDAPLMACLRTLASLRSPAGVRPALRALERKDDLQAVVAGLTFFQVLGDPAHAGAIAWRMREGDDLVNRLFASTLSQLTGEALGTDRARWLKWWESRQLTNPGPEEQPPQGGGGGR